MANLLQDVTYAWRQLKKSPGFAFVAILTLALGIGANTAIFSVMNAVVLRYLPVPNPQELVYLLGANRPGNTSQTGDDDFSFTEYTFEQLRNQHQSFSDIMAFVPLGLPTVAVRYGDRPEEARVDMVSGNFFSGLGVRLARGRGFTADDELRHAQVAVLSYDYWTRRFARSPSAIGKTLYVKGVPFTIIGVAERGFTGVEPIIQIGAMDLWIPLQNRPGKDYPIQGTNVRAGSASSGHRLGERTIELTNKIQEKVTGTTRIEVSPDLKTLTMTTHPSGRSEPNVLVFDRE